jgi:glucose-6-phosphate isomerase
VTGPQTIELGAAEPLYRAAAQRFKAQDGCRRLWARDASLWTAGDESGWLGWLDLPSSQGGLDAIEQLADEARSEGFAHCVVMGMGGSSLCPDVLARTFGAQPGRPEILVLDSTVPAQVARVAERIDATSTLFIVSSKSGGTIEPNSFLAIFRARADEALGAAEAGRRFVAITDPGSSLAAGAENGGFRATLFGREDVGGRFSALSAFGIVPAAVQGLDVRDFLERAAAMAKACGPERGLDENPGVQLGLVLGGLAAAGRDKLTLILSPAIAALGGWLEQLIAESTGKDGKGIAPIDGEAIPEPAQAGDDRLFVYTRLSSAPDAEQDRAVDALAAAGHPVVRVELASPLDLGQEFFRWQIASAVAGTILEINPFNQPDVEAAKEVARTLMASYADSGRLPEISALLEEDGIRAFADGGLHGDSLDEVLASHFARIGAGDYFAINAYVEMCDENDAPLQRLRAAVGRLRGVATTLGYGPRFLHSTGQLHKGGPNSGVFLQITAVDAEDVMIPGQRYGVGVLKQAQANGDFAVLVERGRRALHLHLGSDVTASLETLADRVERVATRMETS